ncbi:MAG: efflux RND transporter periplasmic adaptor subunit [Anaerolineales bacterium]|nr:efflux RND transporter periplasmic adaptor subunit [Anaerolineales bacterium]
MEQQVRKLFKINSYWFLIAAICIGVSGFAVYRLVTSNPGADSNSELTTSTIRTGDIQVSAFGSGTLISAVEIELGFEIEGVVKEILVGIGDEVVEGQLLVRLDDDDLLENLEKAEAALRELTSDAAIATAALEVAEAQKAVLNAESNLRFLISPYVFKSEIRLRDVQQELNSAIQAAVEYPSEEADQKVIAAQEVVEEAIMSLALNWETYYEEYVPDFFNFRWRDRFGFRHDYYDPPSETEVAVVRAELAASEARLDEAEVFLTVLTESVIPDDAYGSQLTAFENAAEAVADAQKALEASRLTAPINGMIVEMDLQIMDKVNTNSIMTVAQFEPLTLKASFDEGDWRLIKEGYPVEVIFDALPEKTFRGQIVFVDPTLISTRDVTLVSAFVELDISETGWADFPLLSAASIEVIAGEVINAVLLSVEGLQDDLSDSGTVLVQRNNDFIQQKVNLGLRDVLYVEVTDGLSVGDVVLIGNYE